MLLAKKFTFTCGTDPLVYTAEGEGMGTYEVTWGEKGFTTPERHSNEILA